MEFRKGLSWAHYYSYSYINDMPDSLSHSVPSLYSDDTEMYASSDNCADLVDKVNLDLEHM
jgi:hypothetical protein